MVASRSGGGAGGGLSYHTAAYWEERFGTDPREVSGFEWLSSSQSLVAAIPRELLLREVPARILHIGVGTSLLSLDLVRLWQCRCADWQARAREVVNVDFSPRSIEFQRTATTHFLDELNHAHPEHDLMQYETLDLLDWTQVVRLQGGCDLVVDKSTADSISTGNDVRLHDLPPTSHPDLLGFANTAQAEAIPTLQLLGIHLAALVKPGGVWLCHSYSSDRWADIQPAAWPWKLTSRTAIPVASTSANEPQLNHYIYTLHRI